VLFRSRPEHRDLLFERFRQLDAGPAKEWQGHGLGLAVVRALLDALEGSVEIGDRPGVGSVFTVRIPEGPAEAPGAGALPRAGGGNELVFDEERF
jgi:signal transduction histidine kinase